MFMEQKGRFWAPLAVDYGYYAPLQAGSIDGTDTIPHDRAVVRAMTAKYQSSKQEKGSPKSTLFVARISHSTKEETLKEAFSKYGKIENCRLVKDIVTGRPKGYAFIAYRHTEDAEKAYHRCHKMQLDGAQIIVEYECERVLPGWVPRRLGGGFGGKKESGQLRFGGRDRPFRKPIILGSKSLRGADTEQDHRLSDWRQRNRDFDRHHRTSERHDRSDFRKRSRSRSRSPHS